MRSLSHQLATLTAAAPPAPGDPSKVPFINQSSLAGVALLAVSVLVTLAGIRILSRSHRSKVKDSLEVGGNVGIGIVMVAIGLVGTVALVAGAGNFFAFFTTGS